MLSTRFKWLALLSCLSLSGLAVQASSHREAPFISQQPKLDATDFYMFHSYEKGRSGYVTLIANYLPLQDPYGGPNYFSLDPLANYDINIDNNGDAKSDLTFRFNFTNTLKNLSLNVGGKDIAVPLVNIGPITKDDNSALNVTESYTLTAIRGSSRQTVTTTAGESVFTKPVDNIGNKSIADYPAYSTSFIRNINIPGCGIPAKVFVGQRKDPFVVNLGETFDLINVTNVLGAVDAEADDLADKNVTSLIMEVPVGCLTSNGDPTIAGWTTTSTRSIQQLQNNPTYDKPVQGAGAFIQQSRLANPLVNEVVIGLKDKNKFNSSQPADDAQFADYVTNPTLPEIIEILYGSAGVRAPNLFPRTDLVSVFLTGVAGVNKTNAVAELMRLNTSIPPVPAASQNNLGVIGGDVAGYPNGRRPGDDVVDISLRVVMGALLTPEQAPSGQLPFTDGAFVDAGFFRTTFPYLNAPIPGSPNNTP
ncbi:DUF4331 domain-containing protein [Candidatus Cyanaurora vandensis]|uniref:DUF4331 domain-containing protein n=1 Tax=Candidatus Cyanaurora vandensis TaxID=2714958 RepID=UPI00257C0EFB|nr:DUF4331 domain-containing protein [Candidatus Cyanaurora vandensis]